MEARCKDKFLVQTVTIKADQEVGNVASIVCLTNHWYDNFVLTLVIVVKH